jgi:hypothetical protein
MAGISGAPSAPHRQDQVTAGLLRLPRHHLHHSLIRVTMLPADTDSRRFQFHRAERPAGQATARTRDLLHITKAVLAPPTWPNSRPMLIRQLSQGRILPL